MSRINFMLGWFEYEFFYNLGAWSADNFCKQLDPDQARQNIGPDLDPNCLTLIVIRKEFFEKFDLEKISRQQKNGKKFPRGQS